MQLRIEIQCDSNSATQQKNLETAIQFGVEKEDALDVKKYVVAFLRKLLLQRKKTNEHLLENYLNRKIEKQWQEVLSRLEDTNRKLINIESGSFILTLFCPTTESRLQFHNEAWKDEIKKELTTLLRLLG